MELTADRFGAIFVVMCKRLDEFLGSDPAFAERFAEKIGVDPNSLRRYRRGEKRPVKRVMERIAAATKGRVMPNDFHDIPERWLVERYGSSAVAELQAAE